jgi:hypothetical protein
MGDGLSRPRETHIDASKRTDRLVFEIAADRPFGGLGPKPKSGEEPRDLFVFVT